MFGVRDEGYSTVYCTSKLWCHVIHNHLIIKRGFSVDRYRGPVMELNKENHANLTAGNIGTSVNARISARGHLFNFLG